MSTPFLSEIKLVAFNFAPKGWAMCNGQLLPINQNQALFSLLGTTYGGDGRTTFALPDLRGAVAMHQGAGYILGQYTGEENHTLTLGETPTHTHYVKASSNAGTISKPENAFPANAAPAQIYSGGASPQQSTTMSAAMVASYGGNQPHPNQQPYLVMTYIIALTGIYPSRN
ncbi:MAG TPA: tail fiber protein [Candidatus Baltobacteraceae bacterium]|nr:tail fiber protein [Candidatus Baltobacteraceae bacterium]